MIVSLPAAAGAAPDAVPDARRYCKRDTPHGRARLLNCLALNSMTTAPSGAPGIRPAGGDSRQ